MRAQLCLLTLVLVPACDAAFDDDPVEIRACNDTEYDFDALDYSDFVDVGALPSGACTGYTVADRELYRYDFVRFVIGPDVFDATPIDFLGETPLHAGQWSYRLTISDFDTGFAGIEAVED